MAWRCWLPALLLLLVLPNWRVALGSALVLVVVVLPSLLGQRAFHYTITQLATARAPVKLPEDSVWRLCEAATRFQEHPKAFQIRTLTARRAFEEACWRALPSLEPAARAELERRVWSGQLHGTLPYPPQPRQGVAQPWRRCGAPWPRKRREELRGGERKIFEEVGVLPLQEREVAAWQVGEAFARGEVARFDARGLVPERMFNTSVRQLGDLHPDVVFHGNTDGRHGYESFGCWTLLGLFMLALPTAGAGSLLEWLLVEQGMMEGILFSLCHAHWTLQDISQRFDDYQPSKFYAGMNQAKLESEARRYMQMTKEMKGLMSSNVNVQRLPRWSRGALDPSVLAAKLGLAGQAEYAHNLLWIGCGPGGIHADIQDNVIVQLVGESEVFLVPPNCSLALEMGAGGKGVTTAWIKERGPDFPFFVVTLRPGDGLAIPSNAMHVVASTSPGRIGMNFFFEPRHGRMRWPGAPGNFYNWAGPGHLAMRDLWVKTIKELWRTREPGAPPFIVHGQRQELI